MAGKTKLLGLGGLFMGNGRGRGRFKFSCHGLVIGARAVPDNYSIRPSLKLIRKIYCTRRLLPMPHISSAPLTRAITRLIYEVDALVDESCENVRPEILDKYARAITSQLKALQEIESHNRAQDKNDERRTYTAYEDFPAPTPDERERFKARLEHLISKIEARQKTSKGSGAARTKR